MIRKIKIITMTLATIITSIFIKAIPIFAQTNEVANEVTNSGVDRAKAIGAAIAIALAALGGAIGIGIGLGKAVDGISRQPEAENKIRTTLILGIVFIETVVIYALIVSILIIFVL